ncbi:MAG: hypothetical protein R6U46_01180 [Marinilabilia sp.]
MSKQKRLSFSFTSLMKLTGALLILFLASCDSDDNGNEPKDPGQFANGTFVLNEGSMGSSNASVSFIPANSDTVQGEIFQEANDDANVLGDILQDMVSLDTLSFLVLNGSESLLVVNNKNFEYVTEITEGIKQPRYATIHNDLLYVTQWGNEGEVVVVDPENFEVIQTVEAGIGPEGIRVINDEVWVANGGIGQDNTISVIDPEQNTVKATIEGKDCPKDLAVDAEGDVWAVCSGYTDWDTGESTTPYLEKIDAENYEVLDSFELPGAHSQIAASVDGQTIYFGGGYGNVGLWAMDYNASELPAEPLIDETLNGLSVDPDNGDIYCAVAPSYEEPGYVSVYDANGNEVALYEDNIGIGPNNFIFVSE